MLKLGVKQTSGTSRIHPMSQNAVLEMFANKQFESVLTVRFWQSTNPVAPVNDDLWYQSVTNVLYYRESGAWYEIEIRLDTIYIKATDASTYYYNGLIMIALGAVLTKAAIEALLTGSIYSHNHNVRSVVLAGYNIDMSLYDDFEKLDCGVNSQFTISNPILKKGFRLTIKGGTLLVPTFSGYTVNWALNSLVTDYVPAQNNYLWCEIKSASQIYCFWGI